MQPLIPSSPAAAATGGETNRFYLWASCLVAALGGLMFGYDWVVISGTAAVRSLSEPLFSPLGRAKRSEDSRRRIYRANFQLPPRLLS